MVTAGGAVTVRVVDPTTLPLVALIVEVPAFTAVASPAALIVATVVVPDAHVAVLVRSCVELSLNVPVAVNCWVFPTEMDGFGGVTAIDESTAAVTVNVVDPTTLPLVALIVDVPIFRVVANPAALIVAIVVVPDAHVAVLVRSFVELSLNVPVAVNCCVLPAGTDGFAGVTAIDDSVAAVTVNVVEPTTAPLVALIVDVPTFTAVASPAALIVAFAGVPDAHVTLPVRSCIELSLNVPIAVNCCVFPAGTDGFAGVTAIDDSTAAVTVNVVVPLTDPDAALIVTGPPNFTPVASPAALIVAMVVSDVLHVTVLVMFCVEVSLNVPVAVNCCVLPAATDGFAGVTAIDTRVAFVTVNVVEPTTLPLVAVIVEVPAFTAVARPAAFIVATVVVPDAHVTLAVRSCVELSLNVPVAVNCCVPATMMVGVAGVTAIDDSVAAVTVKVVEPTTPPLVAVIVEEPTFRVVAKPAALIVATVVVPEAHVTLPVRFCVELSLNVPVAVNCCVFPAATDGFAGVTAMDVSTAAVKVNEVVPLTAPEVALIVTGPPAFTPVAKPAALIVATVVSDELQVTEPVKFCVELSLNVPVAVNCCVLPAGIDGFAGVTAIDDSVAAVTVNVVEPTTAPLVALIVDVPTFTAVANPAALIVAFAGVPDAHVTLPVRSCVELSLNVPVAVNCCVFPAANDGFAGVTAIDDSTAAVTVNVVVPFTDPDAALIVTGPPNFTPVASPVALIVAMVVSDVLHVTVLVMFCVEVSLNVPVAVNCCVFPAATEGFAGVTAIETRVAFVTVSVVEPTTAPLVALIVDVPAFTAVARPAALIVATVVVPDAHVTLPVRFCVELSLNVPVAVNC